MPAISAKGNKSVNELRRQVFRYLIERNGKKYKSFLRYLRIFKYASLSPNRGNFLELYYVLMRYLDDIADGDLPVPEGYENNIEYIQAKIAFSLKPDEPQDEIDQLFLHCFELGTRFNAEFNQETHDILRSLLFDARRLATYQVFPRHELEQHFHQMDIRGTIRATLKIFKDNSDNYEFLKPLGMATRYHYDLEDFEADIAAGYVNIPLEDTLEYNIDVNSIKNRFSPNVYRWFIKQAITGLRLLEDHQSNLQKVRFSLLARATFPLVYVRPAQKYFIKILDECPVQYRAEMTSFRAKELHNV